MSSSTVLSRSTADPSPGKQAPRARSRDRRTTIFAWGLLIPATALIALLLGYPIVRMGVLSLQKAKLRNLVKGTLEWNNYDNFRKILSDDYFWTVLVRTIVFAMICVIVTMILGTLVALLLQRVSSWARLTLSIALLCAWATPAVTATQIWQFLFDTQFGLVNSLLVRLGLDSYRGHSWLAEPASLLGVAALIVVWGAIPFVTLTLYAALTQLPVEIYEAARLDGAGAWQAFRLLTVPMIMPIFVILMALSTIWDFRVFTQVYILQKAGGIARDTDLLGLYAYRTSFSANDFGVGSAIAIVMVVLLVLISVFYIRSMVREVNS